MGSNISSRVVDDCKQQQQQQQQPHFVINSPEHARQERVQHPPSQDRPPLPLMIDTQQQQNQQGYQHQNKQDLEFPYRLTCPGQVLKKANYSLVLGYHVGMLRNWKTIVRDQLHTLRECGLGHALDDWFLSYSLAPTARGGGGAQVDVVSTAMTKTTTTRGLNDLQQLLKTDFSSLPEPQLIPSPGLPWEGTVLNRLREYCINQEESKQSSTSLLNNNNTSYMPTVVFYWHTKGSSRWKEQWRQQMEEPYTYSRVLYWRKYMEYFLQERPAHCIHQIVHHGAETCGVQRQPKRGVYAGNFWAASCRYLARLPQVPIQPPPPPPPKDSSYSNNGNNQQKKKKKKTKTESGYFEAEETFGRYQNDSSWTSPTYVSLHQPPRGKNMGFYYRLIEPLEYVHAIDNWGPDV